MRDPLTTVKEHLDAVHTGDPEAMAADYAPDAVLVRDVVYQGKGAIADYFTTVPERLGDGRVEFAEPRLEGALVAVAWTLRGGPGEGTSGTDRFEVTDGMIVHQTVTLDGGDF
ncbi:MAG: nuclear transport factor 2 family protein [bacterium]|uniref:nuclear transport factor 2 family protein n=1 Tax=Candidatus Poriferisocius sp. TaxID=3101276 RepID=UPI00239E7E24|nr:nuclear transport factor 2 family protein [bacterium]